MRKYICILFALLLVLSLVACGQKTTTEQIEYHFYAVGADGSNLVSVNDVPMNSVTDLQLNCNSIVQTFNDESAPQTITVNVLGTNHQLNYKETVQTSIAISENANFHRFGNYNKYTVEQQTNNGVQKIEAEYDANTGTLKFLSVNNRTQSGTFTEEDAIIKAEEWMLSEFGEDALDGYQVRTSIFDYNDTIFVTYTQYICGLPTSSWARVIINRSGEIIGFNGKNMGILNPMVDNITEEKIQNAENALLQTITNKYTVQPDSRILKLDAESGKCYLQLTAHDSSSASIFYVNIE